MIESEKTLKNSKNPRNFPENLRKFPKNPENFSRFRDWGCPASPDRGILPNSR